MLLVERESCKLNGLWVLSFLVLFFGREKRGRNTTKQPQESKRARKQETRERKRERSSVIDAKSDQRIFNTPPTNLPVLSTHTYYYETYSIKLVSSKVVVLLLLLLLPLLFDDVFVHHVIIHPLNTPLLAHAIRHYTCCWCHGLSDCCCCCLLVWITVNGLCTKKKNSNSRMRHELS